MHGLRHTHKMLRYTHARVYRSDFHNSGGCEFYRSDQIVPLAGSQTLWWGRRGGPVSISVMVGGERQSSGARVHPGQAASSEQRGGGVGGWEGSGQDHGASDY